MANLISETDIQTAKARLRDVLSTQFRREYFGRERLLRLERILDHEIHTEFLLDLIVRQEGPQLLSGRPRRIGQRTTSLRRILLESLDEEALRNLYRALRRQEPPAQRGRVESDLADFKWHRGSGSALRITRALGIPDGFAGIRAEERREPVYEIAPLGELPPLKPFQRGVLRETRTALDRGLRAMVSSFTGTGKTRMGMELVVEMLQAEEERTLVLWVAQKAELLEQACDAVEPMWRWLGQKCGLPLQVFRYWEGEHFEPILPEGPCLVVATAQQAIHRLEQREPFLQVVLSRARLLVVDEAHHALAKGHQRIIEAYEEARRPRRSRVLGLTATPGRSNLIDPRESEHLAQLFGKRLVVPAVAPRGMALHWFQEQGYLSRLRHQKVEAPSQVRQTMGKRKIVAEDDSGYKDYTKEVLEVVGLDSLRNRKILEVLSRLHSEGRHTLVFCCNISQAEMLTQALLVQGISAGVIHHHIDPRDRFHTIAQFRRGDLRTLINVEVLTTGFDAPKVDTLVMCRPTLSRVLYEQMIGRGIRGPEMGGTESCEIVDFEDNFARFDEPQAWEAFWKEWQAPRKEAEGQELREAGWQVIPAEPEYAENALPS